MPEKILKKFNDFLLPQWKVCFFAGLIVGLIAHLYKITNWLPNWDSLVFRYDSQNMLALGRWFLPVVCSFSSFYDLPFLNGIIAIVFYAMGAVCICRILNVQKNVTAGLIGAFIVSFPTITSVMMYNYVADGYGISFFLSTLAALFMTKEKPRYILAAVLITLTIGIYQAYVTVTIMLVLFTLISDIIYNDASFSTVLKKAVHMGISGVLGMALYSGILELLLRIFSVELLDYQGINSSALLSGTDIFGSLYVVKETFVKFFFDLSEGINLYFVINVVVFAALLFGGLKEIVVNKIYKKPVNIIALAVLSVMLIMGAGVLAFVNASIDYHSLMFMGYSVFYLFFIVSYERGTEKNVKHTVVKCWMVFITALVLIANQVVISNVSYHKAQMAYEKSYGVLLRIADRIEQTSGSENCSRILVVGALDNSKDYSVNLPPELVGITDGYIVRADDEIVGQSVFCSAINDYCGKNYEFISGEEKKKIISRNDVKLMEEWPSKNCVLVIDNIVIVKLGSEGEIE